MNDTRRTFITMLGALGAAATLPFRTGAATSSAAAVSNRPCRYCAEVHDPPIHIESWRDFEHKGWVIGAYRRAPFAVTADAVQVRISREKVMDIHIEGAASNSRRFREQIKRFAHDQVLTGRYKVYEGEPYISLTPQIERW